MARSPANGQPNVLNGPLFALSMGSRTPWPRLDRPAHGATTCPKEGDAECEPRTFSHCIFRVVPQDVIITVPVYWGRPPRTGLPFPGPNTALQTTPMYILQLHINSIYITFHKIFTVPFPQPQVPWWCLCLSTGSTLEAKSIRLAAPSREARMRSIGIPSRPHSSLCPAYPTQSISTCLAISCPPHTHACSMLQSPRENNLHANSPWPRANCEISCVGTSHATSSLPRIDG